ncbi:MAG: MCE family protein [Alphaproteobacteria bacterium]|nr:MCE family protein [Alphaproteobacteria bacterium]
METKASYVLVGAFVMAAVAALAGFVIWLAKINVETSYARYDVFFEGSVTGLKEGSAVQYKGVPIGTVIDIGIDPANVERVRVMVEIDQATPLHQDVVASLQLQGITGLSFVQISGGSNEAPILVAGTGERYPMIPSRRSGLEQVFETVPELVERFSGLIERTAVLLSDENQKAFGDTLANVQQITANLAAESGNIGATIEDARATAAALRGTAEEVQALATDLRGAAARLTTSTEAALTQLTLVAGTADQQIAAVSGDLRETLDAFSRTADAASTLADNLDGLVAENRGPLRAFSESGLYEISQFVSEARAMVAVITQIAAQVERDPTRFLLGGQQQGYEAQ